MDMQISMNQIAVLFLLMAAGFVLGRVKVLTAEGNRVFSKFILFVTFPCTVLSAVLHTEVAVRADDTFFFLFMSLLTFAIAFAISIPVTHLMGGKKENRGLLCYLSIFGNVAFMGFPVAVALFGIASAYYVALFNIVFYLFIFSIGILMVSGKGGKLNLKPLLNPVLIVAFVSIPIAIFNISFPFIVTEAISLVGSVTTPTAMIVTGATLAYIPLKNLFSEWRVLLVTAIKLLIIPVVTWFVLRIIITDELMLGVLVVLSAMPSAVMAVMFAIEYNGNERVASAGVFLTTLLCGVTVPLLVYFLFS